MKEKKRSETADCGRGMELLHRRLDGILTVEEAAELDRLLLEDPSLGRWAASFQEMAQLADGARRPAPLGFTDRVMAAIRSDPRSAETGGLWKRIKNLLTTPSFAPRLAGALALGAAVLLGTLLLKAPRVARAPSGAPESQIVLHRFEIEAPQAEKVCLVGDFNDWKLCDTPLLKDQESGTWFVQIEVPRGRHQYMFVVDDQSWITDPQADDHLDDGFGNQNAVVYL